MLRNWCEKLQQNSPTYTWVLRGKNFRLNEAFSGILELKASPVEGQQLKQKDKKKRKSKIGQKNKPKTLKSILVPSVFVSLNQWSGNECLVKRACELRNDVPDYCVKT